MHVIQSIKNTYQTSHLSLSLSSSPSSSTASSSSSSATTSSSTSHAKHLLQSHLSNRAFLQSRRFAQPQRSLCKVIALINQLALCPPNLSAQPVVIAQARRPALPPHTLRNGLHGAIHHALRPRTLRRTAWVL